MTRGFDVIHVAHAMAPLIDVWAGWTWAKRWGGPSRWHESRSLSGISGSAGTMTKRLGRTPLLRRRGLIRAKRWTR